MKVLIFTHKIDIDGMGSPILANLSFEKVDYVLCNTFDINKKVMQYIENSTIYEYDYIYVTDICIKEPLLKRLDNDALLKNKIKIFDHHKSEIAEQNDKYNWVNIVVSNQNGKCCGTSLFYEYLIKEHHLNKTDAISQFVELTRQHDTWEWYTKYNNELSDDLNQLFLILGESSYIEKMTEKLKNANQFQFSDAEIDLIRYSKSKINDMLPDFIDSMKIINHLGYKIGVIFSASKYRNYIAEELRRKKVDIDLVMMIVMHAGTISYRSINPNIDVSEFAVKLGGKGHKEAASSPISNEINEKTIKNLLDNIQSS